MFPEAQDEPPLVAQQVVRRRVTAPIRSHFCSPELGVRFGRLIMEWAPVPEAAVYEHGDLPFRERDVYGPPSAMGEPVMHPVAQALGVQ